MRYQRYISLMFLFGLLSSCLFSQGLTTTASKDDWEEINFEFNSPVLTDGYPSLLRLAELLQKHPDHKVKLEGHADVIGSLQFNQRLGLRRADAVKAFLVKYGAADGQITTLSFGETQPKVPSRDKEARFMNRRVFMTVTDGQGRVVLDRGGVQEAIKTLDDLFALQKKCCDDILRRLDKLDDIANMLQKLVGENDALRKELANLKQAQDALDAYVKGQPKPLTEAQTASIVDTRTAEQIERARMPRYSLLNVNAGSTGDGELTFTGRGRYFMPFKEQFALQVQGEYMYFRDRQEGQADIGLVNRFTPRGQAGIFASFKNVNFSGNLPPSARFATPPVTQFDPGQMSGNGLLGQASLTLDYLFSRGRVGIFGSKGFLQDDVLNVVATRSPNIFTEYSLHTVDQIGASALVGIYGNNYIEGNLGYLRSKANADRVGGTARFVFPLSERFAFTLEGGMNETLVSRGNTGRVVAGVQFGNFMRPKDYMEGYNGIQHAVPADVPRVRYEILTRTIRTGNAAPVANAGPDQLGVPAGLVTLDGSGSFDADGDPLTYQWTQISGPSVSLSGQNTARASFTAAEGQSYGFRLVVRDPQDQQGVDSTVVSTTSAQPVQIVRFQASPDRIAAGQQSTIDWQVLNADTVTITEIGNVPSNGTRAVSPTRTTQYRLTARNRAGEATATTTIVVEEQPLPQFTTCTASPATILSGESSTLLWATSNADSVEISGIGPVDTSGTRAVTPTQTTTYTFTARNSRGPATCSATVTVSSIPGPRIIRFTADPASITSGNASTLSWAVENAETVSISTLGTVAATGSSQVRPTANTTYTLTATNRAGTANATTSITVTSGPIPPDPAPTITSCSASPTTSPAPGRPVTIFYQTTNATSVTFTPTVPGAGLNGPVTVSPAASTTYQITANGTQNRTATCTVAVTVIPTPDPPIPIIVGGPVQESFTRELILDGSASTDPGGGTLTYTWTPLGTGAAVLDQGQARTRVQLAGVAEDYQFRLTVRSVSGQEASTIVTVRFRSQLLP